MFSRIFKNVIKRCSKLNVNSQVVWIIVLIVGTLIVAVLGSSVSYCGARMCANTNAHTFCQFRDGPGSDCMGYIESQLTKDEKARIIARLNRRRSDAASGRLRGIPPAGNMLKLRWVEELAREAQLWADQCRAPRIPEENDVCRDLYSTTIGQCVASVIGEAPGLRVESMIDMWYMQNIHYKGNVTSYEPPPNDSGFYGDFAQILWANTYMVGCGHSRFMATSQGRLRSVERLVCNFAPRGPPASRALWLPAVPASACSSRSEPDRILTALCTYQPELDETHDLDNSMTLEEHIILNMVLEMEGKDNLNYRGSLDELYLKKLAIITMGNIETSTPYYSSIQKRDIAELISLEDAKKDVYKIAPNENFPHNRSAILNMIKKDNISNNSKSFKRKLSFIGRPKAYNIEELNDVKNEIIAQNIDESQIDGVLQREKEFYAEYGIIESENENITFVESLTEMNVNELYSIEVTSSFKAFNNTIPEISTNSVIVNVTPWFNEPFKVRDNLEDYVNDSETVQELQEALDRMEQTLEPIVRVSHEKVRRDLRNFPDNIDVTDNPISVSDSSSVSPEELERNKTIERGPMLNMVLRYLPYLKQYENDILGKSANACEAIDCYGFDKVFCLYLCFFIVLC